MPDHDMFPHTVTATLVLTSNEYLYEATIFVECPHRVFVNNFYLTIYLFNTTTAQLFRNPLPSCLNV